MAQKVEEDKEGITKCKVETCSQNITILLIINS